MTCHVICIETKKDYDVLVVLSSYLKYMNPPLPSQYPSYFYLYSKSDNSSGKKENKNKQVTISKDFHKRSLRTTEETVEITLSDLCSFTVN